MAAAIFMTAALPAISSAATVSSTIADNGTEPCFPVGCVPALNRTTTVTVRGHDAAEALIFAAGVDGVMRFTDPDGVVAGPGCVQEAPETVRCESTPAAPEGVTYRYRVTVEAQLGGGDDTFLQEGTGPVRQQPGRLERVLESVVEGEAGVDVIELTGSPGNALGGPGPRRVTARAVSGGEDDDVLTIVGFPESEYDFQAGGSADGGPGDDRVNGSSGYDTITVSEGLNVIDGGAGVFDELTAKRQTSGVTVDLGGPAIENVERLIGGLGDDVLTGDDGPN